MGFEVCAKCGRKVKAYSGNSKLTPDGWEHVKCPDKDLKSPEYSKLIDRVYYHLNMNPSDWLKTSGLNFKKVANQVKSLKDKGYSYEDQLYALDYLVENKGQFFGYTFVVNNISWVLEKRNQLEKKKELINEEKHEEKIYDLSNMIESGDDEW